MLWTRFIVRVHIPEFPETAEDTDLVVEKYGERLLALEREIKAMCKEYSDNELKVTYEED